MAFGDKPLLWDNSAQIAAALDACYPDCDRLQIDHPGLMALIRNLDDFQDTGQPNPRQLDHILWSWMRLAAGQGAG